MSQWVHLQWWLNSSTSKNKCDLVIKHTASLFSHSCDSWTQNTSILLQILLSPCLSLGAFACSAGLYSISQSSPICFLPVCLLPSLLWLYYYYYRERWKAGTTEEDVDTTEAAAVFSVCCPSKDTWNKPRHFQNIWHLSPCLVSPLPLSPSPLCALVSDGLSLPPITSTYQ